MHTTVQPAELDAAVDAVLREVLAGGREAIAAAKQLIDDVWQAAPTELAEVTAAALAKRRESAEGQEGLRAFLEKRTPGWSGV